MGEIKKANIVDGNKIQNPKTGKPAIDDPDKKEKTDKDGDKVVNGKVVKADGSPMLKDGKPVTVDKDGNKVDALGNVLNKDLSVKKDDKGNAVKTADPAKAKVKTDKDGDKVSKNGKVLNADGSPKTD